MKDIKQISDEIYDKEKTKSYRDFIDKYKQYESEIENTDYQLSQEIYDIYSQLIADLGIALSNTKSYKKAIPVLNRAFDLFLNNKKYTSEKIHNVGFYEALLYNRGICNINLNHFELARNDFELLMKLYPDNTEYSNWIKEFKNKRLYKLRNIVMYILIGSILILNFFDRGTIENEIVLGIGLCSLGIELVIELTVYLRRRNYST